MTTKVETFEIPEQPRAIAGRGVLDKVTLYIENYSPGRGKLTVHCYDRTWHAFWGSMGDGYSVQKFLTTVNSGYVSSCLLRSVASVITNNRRRKLEHDHLQEIATVIINHFKSQP